MVHQFIAKDRDYDKTLSELTELGLGIKFKCSDCGAESDLEIGALIRAHGAEPRLRYVQRNAKCPYCSPK